MKLNKYIDHTLLKADAREEQIIRLCQEAREHDFASCCVNPYYVPLVKKLLSGSDVKVCTVIGFPLGASAAKAKAAETRQAILDGADEIDMVINIGALKDGHLNLVRDDIAGVVAAAQGRIVKVIIETCLLTDAEKVTATKLIAEAKAHFVKTSTGFSTGGATLADVKLLKSINTSLLIKASGGIKDAAMLKEMIAAGANRIGTSSGITLLAGEQVKGGY